MELTEKQKSVNHETWRHINRVQQLMSSVVKELIDRAVNHDQSKLESPEVEYFAEYTDKLAETTFGSPEYEELKEKLKPALDHHYANNTHHPEHWKSGVDDMTLLDLIEMLVDWKAASERHNNGNINKSIELNGKRFEMSPQLVRIFENTAKKIF